jgi:drug/metabolite transporter (DMT)-like permease
MVLVKMVVYDLSPLTLAGLRYSLGAVVLVPFMGGAVQRIRRLAPGGWFRLIVLGVCGYALANLAIFKAMQTLPATMGAVGMNLLPVVAMLVEMWQLQEFPQRSHLLGLAITALGGLCFFTLDPGRVNASGLIFLSAGILGHGVLSVIGRRLALESSLHAIELTAIPLGVGGLLLLVLALCAQGLPVIPKQTWWVVLWMALMSTAVAYGLYNYALRALRAFEVNMLLNLSPLVSAGLAWALLGESLAAGQIFGMASLIFGVVLVQRGSL